MALLCVCMSLKKQTIDTDGEGFEITVKPYEIQTYRVRF